MHLCSLCLMHQIFTLLDLQVDSSVGGKTAINHSLGKNLIGAFYQPQCTLIDTNTLNTLPDRELASGLAEAIKCGLVRDADFFEWQERNIQAIMARYESYTESNEQQKVTGASTMLHIPLNSCSISHDKCYGTSN